MLNQDKDTKSFSRRAFLIGGLQMGFLGVLGGRLAWLQVVQGQRYKMLADNNRINVKMIAPSRGRIVDRYGTPLAVNGQNFRVLMIPEQVDNVGVALSRLQELLPLSQNDIKRVLKQAESNPGFVPLEVKDKLSWEEMARVEVHMPELPGLSIDEGEIRSYPLEEATAHITGYVGAVSQSELDDDPVLSLPGFRTGKTGIEKTYDEELRGTAGTAEVEVNVVGREIRTLGGHPGKEGQDIRLTIDANLQTYIQDRLSREKSASAVVMDVQTGAVYGLSSAPSFDPNLFVRGLSAEQWEGLLADPGLPLNNKAVGGQYPPASTFKMVTAIAMLEEGVAHAGQTAHCPGYYDFGGDRFHCWRLGGHGHVNMVDALAESCDTYFYKFATELGIDKLAHYANLLGLGEKLGFELTEERPGLMPTKDWKLGHMGKVWQPGETIVSSIGQGYIQATPLQLAVMTSRLVNGGKAVNPWITDIRGRELQASGRWKNLGLKAESLRVMRRGMRRVTMHRTGTAYKARIQKAGFEMGGKTGTAQVRRISLEERQSGVENEDLPWKLRHHALFVGYAPLSLPRYSCAVVVDHGGSGSAAAAPIARDILLKTQELNPAVSPFLANVSGTSVEADKIQPPRKPRPSRSKREG